MTRKSLRSNRQLLHVYRTGAASFKTKSSGRTSIISMSPILNIYFQLLPCRRHVCSFFSAGAKNMFANVSKVRTVSVCNRRNCFTVLSLLLLIHHPHVYFGGAVSLQRIHISIFLYGSSTASFATLAKDEINVPIALSAFRDKQRWHLSYATFVLQLDSQLTQSVY